MFSEDILCCEGGEKKSIYFHTRRKQRGRKALNVWINGVASWDSVFLVAIFDSGEIIAIVHYVCIFCFSVFVWPLVCLNRLWLWMINIAAIFKPAHQLSINLLLAEFKVFCCKWAEKQKEDYLLEWVWLWTVCLVCQHHKIKPEAKKWSGN